MNMLEETVETAADLAETAAESGSRAADALMEGATVAMESRRGRKVLMVLLALAVLGIVAAKLKQRRDAK